MYQLHICFPLVFVKSPDILFSALIVFHFLICPGQLKKIFSCHQGFYNVQYIFCYSLWSLHEYLFWFLTCRKSLPVLKQANALINKVVIIVISSLYFLTPCCIQHKKAYMYTNLGQENAKRSEKGIGKQGFSG